jgi:spermidine synthase
VTTTELASKERRPVSGASVLLPVLFFVSGFCGLLYQTVWMRLAFARFGVITPVVSVVVSVFMLGLGLGAYLGGKYVGVLSERLRVHAIVLYGAVELVIGAGALAVPALFTASARPLLRLGETNSWSYLAASGACIAVSVLPFSLAMGAT